MSSAGLLIHICRGLWDPSKPFFIPSNCHDLISVPRRRLDALPFLRYR